MSTFIVGDVLAEKYEIKAILGAGGMGTVYRARQLGLGRDVAIKVPNPQALEVPGFLARFSREAKLVARLTHDNIVQVYEYHEGDDGVYIVMEFVEGNDLKRLVTKPPSDLKVRDLATMLRASCEGLGHAHEFGIVHRDIKPHNIMVQSIGRRKWRVKIMDFGIAHLGENTNMTMQQEQLTITGQAIGTPTYMSPEQIRGTGVKAQSDIYSFGCVAFYCFTRQTPFMGTGFTVAASHLSDAPPAIRSRVPSLPPELDAVISRCLEKSPSDRPQDAADLGDELYKALEPIFDKKMTELWPDAQEAPAGTDVVHPTVSLQSGDPVPTVQGGAAAPAEKEEDKQPVVSPDFEPTAVDHKKSFEGEHQGAGEAQADPVSDAGSLTKASPEQVTDATIPYQGVAAPAVGEESSERVSSDTIKKFLPIAIGVFVILLLGGVVVGLVVMNKSAPKDVADTGGPSGGADMGGHTTEVIPPGDMGGSPDDQGGVVDVPLESPEPTLTPVEQVVKPTVEPSATPEPTPTVDVVKQRLAAVRDRFERAADLPAKIRVWQEVREDKYLRESESFDSLVSELAEEITFNPSVSGTLGGGAFTMGSNSADRPEDEQPAHYVTLSSYQVGVYEVTAVEFATFLNDLSLSEAQEIYAPTKQTNIQYSEEEQRWVPAENRALYPANAVTWAAANSYADWLSARTGSIYRLPSEAEWENAASGESGGTGNLFPWGPSEPDATRAQYDRQGTVGVDEMVRGRNPLGLNHMAGNVAEWCLDWYSENAYENQDTVDPRGPGSPPSDGSRPRRVIRGGSYLSLSGDELRVTKRERMEPDKRQPDIGFRLVREVPGS